MASSALARRYRAGEPVAVLADGLGVDLSTLHRRLRPEGVAPRGRPGAAKVRAVLTARRLAEIRRRLDGGESMTSIAATLGISREPIARALRLPPQAGDADAAVALYQARMTVPAVAARLGVHPRTVTRWLARLGVELRSPGRSAGR